jgi:dTDP-4-amino-4,6-dideoxygalactose transaminase
MDTIAAIAARHGLAVIEDAAQGIMSRYKGRPLGSIGALGALSFHETKNVIAGEGGALMINDARFCERAEIIREKGTNRSRFFRGEVDKYTWVDVGSSYLPGEIIAAFLASQLEHAESITARRMAIWQRYYDWAASLEANGDVRRPIVPTECVHNAHMFYLLLRDIETRTRFIGALKAAGIGAVFHYVPLHSSPAGQRFCRVAGRMTVTDDVSDRLVRMPLWAGLEDHQQFVLDTAGQLLGAS